MRISNASMCSNVTRCSQYIVMYNTGATDLEIDIMKVHYVVNISGKYSYLFTI